MTECNPHAKPSGAQMQPPPPRQGDDFTPARSIINVGRLVMPKGSPRPVFQGNETLPERRVILADFLRTHGVPVPAFLPLTYGWSDVYTGELANPRNEPGADGRRFS